MTNEMVSKSCSYILTNFMNIVKKGSNFELININVNQYGFSVN